MFLGLSQTFEAALWSMALLFFFLTIYEMILQIVLFESWLVRLTFESKALTAVVLQMSLAFWLPQITQDVAQYAFYLLSKQFHKGKKKK